MTSDLNFQSYPFEDKPPAGWELTSLENIVQSINPGFASGEHNREGDGIPHLRPMNINPEGEIDLSDVRYVSPDKNSLRIRKGDILFNNTNSVIWVGKCAVNRENIEYAFSNHMTRIKVNENHVNGGFIARQLHYLSSSGYFQVHCKKHVNQASISSKLLGKSVPILLPPINEQKRIVAKIEELQSRSRRAKDALETIPDLLEQLRQSILAAVFRGDLTKKWREQHKGRIESAAELLKRISIDRRNRWEDAELEKLKTKGITGDKLDAQFAKRRKQYKAPPPLDTTDLPELPDGWCWASLAELSYDRQYGSSAKSSKSGKIPVLRMGNLQNGEIDWSDLVYSSDDDEIAKYHLSPNTVLFNRTNSPELVGKTAIYRGDREAIFAGYLIRITNLPQILPTYLNLILNSPFIKHYCSMVKSDAVNQSNINATKLGNFPIPLCSEMEQAFAVSLVEPILLEIIRKTTLVAELSNRLNALEKSTLSQAFCGELVPQDPNDEPASILLQRIREEATKRVPEKKTRPRATRKRFHMKKMDKASVLKVIEAMPQETFAFDELRQKLPSDYDALKDILFTLLDDPQSGVIQVFDKQAKALRFRRRLKQ